MKTIKILVLILLLTEAGFGTIRYVSKTGSSTPPYTSWETASDSISKCLSVCYARDTVIIGKGIYKERFDINVPINLFGVSTDSCIVDGSELPSTPAIMTYVNKSLTMSGLTFRGINADVTGILYIREFSTIRNCIFENADGSTGGFCGFTIENCIFRNVKGLTYANLGYSPDRTVTINNCLFFSKKNITSLIDIWHGKQIITNNIILRIAPSSWGYYVIHTDTPDSFYVYNNLISNFQDGIYISAGLNQIGTGQISNNMVCYNGQIMCHTKLKVVNNIIVKSNNGLNINTVAIPPLSYEGGYNMFWMNKRDTYNFPLKETDIIADPMFVKDTIPGPDMAFDFHLQAFSPGIDAGDPSILDADGSRSDIGLYGGPYGEEYKYLDLAPRKPYGIVPEINGREVTIKWRKNSEADTSHYVIYRDTVSNFLIDSLHIFRTQKDTLFQDSIQGTVSRIYYRLQAVDKQGNKSNASEEIVFVLSDAGEYQTDGAFDYHLYQNYPNPFNPNTVIGYQLPISSYVKVMVYDIKGELLEVLVNENKPAGYYEVEFNAGKYASGIYLYRIEAVDESGIPRYMDMKKMMLVK